VVKFLHGGTQPAPSALFSLAHQQAILFFSVRENMCLAYAGLATNSASNTTRPVREEKRRLMRKAECKSSALGLSLR
jgi:hypothetical protein